MTTTDLRPCHTTDLRSCHTKRLKRESQFIIRCWERYDHRIGLHLTTYVVRDPDGRKVAELETGEQARESARGYAEMRAA